MPDNLPVADKEKHHRVSLMTSFSTLGLETGEWRIAGTKEKIYYPGVACDIDVISTRL